MAQLSQTPHPDFVQQPGESYRDFDTRAEAALSVLEARTRTLAPGEVVGAVIQFPVADNYARYQVMSDKPLVLRHLGYMDGYSVDAATIRGLRLSDVQQMVSIAQYRARLFDQAMAQNLAKGA